MRVLQPAALWHVRRQLYRWQLLVLLCLLVGVSSSSIARFRPAAAAGPSVTYPAGWNLISAPTGATMTYVDGSVYTFQIGDAQYEALPNSNGASGVWGYWGYFATAKTVTLGGESLSSGSVAAPAGQFIMIGNPSATQDVVVTEADVVFTYDPVGKQYAAATMLHPGQGAWAMRATEGSIRMTAQP